MAKQPQTGLEKRAKMKLAARMASAGSRVRTRATERVVLFEKQLSLMTNFYAIQANNV